MHAPIRPATGLSPAAAHLVRALLDRRPEQRLGARAGAGELARLPFFAALEWEAVRQRRGEPPIPPRRRVSVPCPEALAKYRFLVAQSQQAQGLATPSASAPLGPGSSDATDGGSGSTLGLPFFAEALPVEN